MQILTCEDFASRGQIERYVARKLAEEERSVFEAHFLTCDRCQQAVLLGSVIRQELPRARAAQPARRWILMGGGLGLAAAAGLAAILLLRRQPPNAFAELGALGLPPIYLGVSVRADAPTSADSLFGAAMTAYVAGRHAEAARGLRSALRAGVDSAPAEFFLASSLLMTRQPDEAADHFARVIALGDSPYLAEAHFYRAKALLQLGRSAEAVADLGVAAGLGGVIGAHARALADSVQRVAR